jgi:hypothetical protein
MKEINNDEYIDKLNFVERESNNIIDNTLKSFEIFKLNFINGNS